MMNIKSKLSNLKSRSMIIVILVILALGSGAYWFSGRDSHSHNTTEAKASEGKTLYHCPMHPEVVQDEPGICPICHMDLQKIENDEAHAGHMHDQNDMSPDSMSNSNNKAKDNQGSDEREILFYRHPMQPDITSDKPAKDEMGMDYIPVYADEVQDANASAAGAVQGRAGFTLSPEKQQLIGVTSTEVDKRSLSHEIRATGRVAFDPELFTAIEEYRQALIASGQMSDSPYASLKDQSNALVASAKTKLKLMGLTNDQIRKLGRSGSDAMSLLLPEGKVWVYAEVFEYEMGGVQVGQRIEATAPSIPGEVFTGKISSISPILDAPTRTVRVRAEVPDPKGLLRPDTFLNVKIINDMGEKLAIPEDSVMHTGDQAYVFVVQENGRFEPQPVTLGQKAGSYFEVLEGLKAGQRVVTGANFLIDSESRLRSVLVPKKNSSSQSEKSQVTK